MKAMPLPFEQFQGKGVLDYFTSASTSASALDSSDSFSLLLLHQQPQKWTTKQDYCYVGSTSTTTEPTSVLHSRRSPSPSPPISSYTTMSSSLGSSNNTTAAPPSENHPPPHPHDDWDGQDQSLLRLIMGDVEDPSAGLTKLLQNTPCASQNVDFHPGFGVVDQQQGLNNNIDPSSVTHNPSSVTHNNYPSFPFIADNAKTSESMFSASANYPTMLFSSQQQQLEFGVVDEKPQVINPHFMLNHNQVQFSENPSFFVPLSYPQVEDQQLFSKRPLFDTTVGHNYQVPRLPFLDSGQQQQHQAQLPLFPHHYLQQQPSAKQQKVNCTSTTTGDDASNQLQQSIFDQLYKSAELIEAGNPVHAQGILARLNHQLSPIGKPFQRAAFYMKEALQLMLHSNIHNFLAFSPISFIFKIGAYKSFSEISPVLQFANFTSNQALIEALERFDRIHIIDFDIGFGVQWSSFMQELVLRSSGAPSLKVTAVVSPSNCYEIELNFTRENLNQYAKDLNMAFEFNVLNIESLNSIPSHLFENEAIAVNLPVSCFMNFPTIFPMALHFVKQLRPKVVVTLDRNCDRIDVPLSTNVVHVLQCYSALLESLDAVNVNLDVLQKIERHFIQPAINKIVLGHHRSHDKLPPWRNLFLQSGFSQFTFSNFTEAQAECLVQRAPVRGFQVERKPSSLVLCWQRKELISVSTWRC